jgi:hypothetical protein
MYFFQNTGWPIVHYVKQKEKKRETMEELESYSPTQASRELLWMNDARQAYSDSLQMPPLEEAEDDQLESYSPTQASRNMASSQTAKSRKSYKSSRRKVEPLPEMTISCEDIASLHFAVFGLTGTNTNSGMKMRGESLSYIPTYTASTRRSGCNRRKYRR